MQMDLFSILTHHMFNREWAVLWRLFLDTVNAVMFFILQRANNLLTKFPIHIVLVGPSDIRLGRLTPTDFAHLFI
jgi:hypothetical protein